MKTTGPAHVAIVGCGFTGTSTLFQLIDGHPVREITLFEKSGCFGPGYPYQATECRDYLLNNTTDTMCIVPGNRRAFLDWLSARSGAGAPEPKGYLPRSEFGAFLTDVVRSALTMAAVKGIRVHTVGAEVTALRETAPGIVELEWPGGRLTADAVILATGRCPGVHPHGLPRGGPEARYFATHIGCDELERIPLDATCHVLGASLSAYDVVNRLFGPDTGCRFESCDGRMSFVSGPNQRHVVLCSRSGRLKKVQSLVPMQIHRTRLVDSTLQELARQDQLTLVAIADLASEEAKLHGAAVNWAQIFDPYRDCRTPAAITQRATEVLASDIDAARSGGGANFLVDLLVEAQSFMWDAFAARWLPPEEEHRYRTTVEPAFLTYAAPCPVPTAQRLLALLNARRLTIRQGVGSIAPSSNGSVYRVSHRFGEDLAKILINTTGAVDRRVRSECQSPLVASLRTKRALRPYTLGGVEYDGADVDMSTFRAIGTQSIYLANMFLWGPGFFTSSAFTMATIVERMLRAMYHHEAG